ncbi:MAG: CotH kinase family protein [Rikenellaceae bacterium]
MNKYLLALLLPSVALFGCRNDEYIEADNFEYVDTNDDDTTPADDEDLNYDLYPDWSEATHSNSVDPNFDVVFAQNTVLRIDITISTSNLSAMQADLKSNLSSSSNNMFGNMNNDVDFTPIWVPCTLSYNGKDWYEVGIRYKGNSSLSTIYSTSSYNKYSFKLDFDEYEYEYPELKNQRFYGFKQLNLNNNYNDKSFIREKVVTDMFRKFGIAAANTSFCELYINDGYFGLYTLVEEIDDSVIKTQFSDKSGNLYKPEDDAAQFKSGSYDTSEFNLKTNTDIADYSDVRELYDAIQNSVRTSDTESYKERLEAIFDVEGFMRWLAVTTTIQNWDTYGNMAHNYFLYNDITTGQLVWIPWDHNEAMASATGNYYTYTPDQLQSTRYVSSSWPLISYLIAIDEYKEIFDSALQEFIDDIFIPDEMTALYESYYTLLKDYVYAERSGYTFLSYDSQFDSAISTLKTHVTSRNSVITSYLN